VTAVLEGIIVSAEEGIGGLVTIQDRKPVEIFTTPGVVAALLEMVSTAALDFTPDLTTDKGRKEIASRAFRVAKTKTYLDDLGKEEVARLKDLPRQIDAGRKTLRDGFDLIRDATRQPLTDWEAIQERIEAEKKAAEAAAAVQRQVENDHELGLLLNEVFDRKREDARKAKEQEQKDREERIAKEAREKAEARAKADLEAAARREEEAALEALAATARLEQEKKDSAEREIRAREEAAAAERKRQADEQARVDAETAKRTADVEHRRKFNTEALADIHTATLGLIDREDVAKAILTAIVQSKVRHVSIAY
jgi:hypothetical protein